MAKSGFSGKNILVNLIVTIVAGFIYFYVELPPSIFTLRHFIASSSLSPPFTASPPPSPPVFTGRRKTAGPSGSC